MEVIIRLLGAVKHVARLRSWRERRRTTVCCVVRRTLAPDSPPGRC